MPMKPSIAPKAGSIGDFCRQISRGRLVPRGSPSGTMCSANAALASWILLVGPRDLNTTMLAAIARLGEGGPVRVLDGGNRFNAYTVARAIRLADPSTPLGVETADVGLSRGDPLRGRCAPQTPTRLEILNRITVSRAFTCYQVLSLLESISSAPLGAETADGGLSRGDPLRGRCAPQTPPQLARPIQFPPAPALGGIVVLDLLSTFYDESVQVGERKRLLRACITHLERLAGSSAPSIDDTSHGDDMLRKWRPVPRGCFPCGDDVTSAASTDGGMSRGDASPAGTMSQRPPQLVVSVHPPRVPSQAAVELLGMLQASAVDTYFIQQAAPAPEPVRLF
jgi:hypothetical protein